MDYNKLLISYYYRDKYIYSYYFDSKMVKSKIQFKQS